MTLLLWLLILLILLSMAWFVGWLCSLPVDPKDVAQHRKDELEWFR